MQGQVEVTPIAGACGAVVSGVNLSQPLGNETFAAVHHAFLNHQVIFFRDQDLTPGQQIGFSRRFGELWISEQYEALEGYPEIIEIVKDIRAFAIIMGVATLAFAQAFYILAPEMFATASTGVAWADL